MTYKNKYAIHRDFKFLPVFNFSFRPLVVALINTLLRLQRVVMQHGRLKRAIKHHITASDGSAIEVLQFKPSAAAREPLPAVIYLHGGAYVLTYMVSHIKGSDLYANQADCTVFLVDYRLAHRNPFPDGFDDCHQTLTWVVENAQRLGVDPTRIAVMGDSAGGGLAAGLAQRVADERARGEQAPTLTGQVLLYPTLDRHCQTFSATDFVRTPLWNAISNYRMWESYLRGVTGDPMPPYASPADRRDLTKLPEAYIETAEFDPLRDEALAYAERLQADDVAVELNQTKATVHGFDQISISQVSQRAMQRRCDYLRSLFH